MTRIWVPKAKIYEPPTIGGPRARVAGYLALETLNRYGRVTRRVGPWRQLITNYGMDRIIGNSTDHTSNGGVHYACRVGTGTPTFTPGSTGLDNSIAVTTTLAAGSVVEDTTGSDGYRARFSVTRRFGLGAIAANISEVGFFTSSTDATTGVFLDLVRDADGNPATFPVTTEDQLQVTHILDVYPSLDDVDASFTLTGNSGGNFDFVWRSSSLHRSTPASHRVRPRGRLGLEASTYRCIGVLTTLGGVDENPTGSEVSSPNASASTGWGAPSNDGTVWTVTRTFTLGLTEANTASGNIAALLANGDSPLAASNAGWKMAFDPPIPKYADEIQRILSLNLRASLVRA